MGEVRGERVVFRRKDIVPLHELPSAQAHEPIVLHAVDASRTNICMRLAAVMLTVFLLIGAVLVGLVEMGTFDSTLNARAVDALNKALGPRYRASVDHTVVRLSGFGRPLGRESFAQREAPHGVNLLESDTRCAHHLRQGLEQLQ